MRNVNLNPNEENLTPAELEVEKVLRPSAFEDFAGQEQASDRQDKAVEIHISVTLSMNIDTGSTVIPS